MDARAVGLLLIVAGIGVALIGALVMAGFFGWFGRLPGDIRIEGEKVRVFVPIASMIVISVVLTLLVNLARRLF